MVVADAGLLENRRAPATTLEGWRAFITADPSELALLPRDQWQALGEQDIHHGEAMTCVAGRDRRLSHRAAPAGPARR